MRDNIIGGALTETTLLILLSVYSPNHGYGIMQFIDKETNGRVILGAGTLYGAISTLIKKGWIKGCIEEKNNRRKDYIITTKGKEVVNKEMKRLEQLYKSAMKITCEGS